MNSETGLSKRFDIEGRNFSRAGMVSTKVKEILKEIGIALPVLRRVAIAAYEAEMNVVMYALRGRFTLSITPRILALHIDDEGPGIADIALAMQEGFSTATDEMREMGFGAGMGLPNIKKNADRMEISSIPGRGTALDIFFDLTETKET
jgi:anti-sigma regulatory factor (Ser/Thr protein kinase)